MSIFKFLHPNWRPVNNDARNQVNDAILKSLDRTLTEVEKEAIESKVHTMLGEAQGYWLDRWGEWFKTYRITGETDDAYRQRMKDKFLLLRGTIPAIKAAIRAYLNDYESELEIYEPYNNIFMTNSSKLNGEDKLMGDYYRFGIIDIKLSTPFTNDLLTLVNEFKPAGIEVYSTFDPSLGKTRTVIFTPRKYGSENILSEIDTFNGYNDYVTGEIKLNVPNANDRRSVFFLNRSRLNSRRVLAGSYFQTTGSYHYMGISEKDFSPKKTDVFRQFHNELGTINSKYYENAHSKQDDLAVEKSIQRGKNTFVYFGLDVLNYMYIEQDRYLAEVTDGQQASNEHLVELLQGLRPQVSAYASIGGLHADFQVFNYETGLWESLKKTILGFTHTDMIAQMDTLKDYLSDWSFTAFRLVIDKSDVDYVLAIPFFQLAFNKYLENRLTVGTSPKLVLDKPFTSTTIERFDITGRNLLKSSTPFALSTIMNAGRSTYTHSDIRGRFTSTSNSQSGQRLTLTGQSLRNRVADPTIINDAGGTYIISMDVRCNSDQFSLGISTGNPLHRQVVPIRNTNGGWERVSASITIPNDGEVRTSLTVWLESSGGTGAFIDHQREKLEKGTVATPYSLPPESML